MASEVSPTRLYLGNLPRDVTKEDIYAHFKEAPGEITEVKLMNGFGFIEYKDAMDARDVVPNGSDLNGSRLTVQFARGSRPRGEGFPGPPDRTIHPRPRRTAHRMQITGLPGDTSWQDLKDFSRHPGVDVVYSEVGRERDGKGFVEFENASDLKLAVEKLDGTEFKGSTVSCIADTRSPATDATVALGLHLLGGLILQIHTMAATRHLRVGTARGPIIAAELRLLITTGMRTMAVIVHHLPCEAQVGVLLLKIIVTDTAVTRTPPHQGDHTNRTLTWRTGMGGRGKEPHHHTTSMVQVGRDTGDSSSFLAASL
ncbi:MAG: hypothetical protein LQ351_003113 [Letrouitia transgressa]|nr:MAG: hypothetical protein LQ351_003113 [Letrouitia transgressa]